MRLIILFLLSINLSMAQQESDIHIHSLDPNLNPKEFGGKYKKHSYEDFKKEQSKNTAKSKLPPPKYLTELFEKSKLTDETKTMDQMDKDMLFMKAKKYKIDALKKNYPNISEDKLVSLKKNIDEIGKK